MENIIIHKADTRGHANHGWLNAHHSFSFTSYHNPARMNFGVLRVLNDDYIAAGMGFGTHPHENMEIITIPLEGELVHKDSMNNTGIIKHGDIQVMSAGTGIYHSEHNNSKINPLKLFQIWLFPNKQNVTPRYDQLTLNIADRHNNLQQILSPNENDEGVWIHQDAWFSLGKFDKDFSINYNLKRKGNGVHIFVIKGDVEINNNLLNTRDAIGITNTDLINIKTLNQNAEILVMDIPMNM
jgi:redox-sensitive bicupin YhaK (pirin superfamily)